MSTNSYSYSIFFDFIECYLPSSFLKINANDPIMKKLEALMEENNQMMIVMDLTEVKILYTSKRSKEMLGIDPVKNNPSEMMNRVHPEDLKRFGLGRSKLINIDRDLYIENKGAAILSTNVRMQKPDKKYANHLFQFYLFFSPTPHKATYSIQVNTDIEWFNMKKNNFHYYAGSDVSLFKFPDENLLNIGFHISKRELEILELIAKGLNSEQIAEKLFLSHYTINTHRGNILKKTNKSHISELIYDLKESGLL